MKLLFYIFCILPTIVFSQHFSTKIDINNVDNNGYEIVASEDENIYVVSQDACVTDNGTVQCIGISKLDTNGDVVWKKQIDTLGAYYSKLIAVKNNELYLICKNNAQPLENEFHVLKLDSDGNQLEFYDINDVPNFVAPLEIKTHPEGFMINYLHFTSSYHTARVAIYDDEFNHIRHTDYANSQDYVAINHSDSDITANGNILVTNSYGFVSNKLSLFTKIDPQGNIVRQNSSTYVSSYKNPICPTIELQNGNYCSVWQKEWEGPFLQQDFSFSITGQDTTGLVLWEQDFPDITRSDYGRIEHIFVAQNGDIVGVGLDNRDYEGFDDYSDSGWIFRLTQEGELIWTQTIADFREGILFSDLHSGLELTNGDLMFCGSAYFVHPDGNFLTKDQWIVKTGPDGCLVPDCDTYQFIYPDTIYTPVHTVVDPLAKELNLYPNPVQDVLTIKNMEGPNVSYDIIDVLGKTRLSGQINGQSSVIDMSSLASGTYYVHVLGYKPSKIVVL